MTSTENETGRRPARGARRKGKRHPLATVALLFIGLLITGGAYAAINATSSATAEVDMNSPQTIEQGQKLFVANCATCHNMNAEGVPGVAPSLIGVGAASVDFQVGTGRMPMSFQGPQALQKPPQFTDEQIKQMAAYIASLAPGPAIPSEDLVNGEGDVAMGGELFRVNCAMCHNVAGAGGALTEGKFAPDLSGVSGSHIFEAMLTGPQNMPVFNDTNITPEHKKDIIAYLKFIDSQTSVGGYALASLGPVAEGLFIWIFGAGVIIAITVWITARSN